MGVIEYGVYVVVDVEDDFVVGDVVDVGGVYDCLGDVVYWVFVLGGVGVGNDYQVGIGFDQDFCVGLVVGIGGVED